MSARSSLCAATAAIVLALATPTTADELDAATIADVFVAACSVTSGTPLLQDAEPSSGVARIFFFQSGPPPGTLHGQATFRGQTFELVAREGELCVLRFDPLPPEDLRAALTQRLGNPTENGVWRVPRTDGEGRVAYRPFAEGQSGPGWIGRPGGYDYGVDAAARADTLVFYPP